MYASFGVVDCWCRCGHLGTWLAASHKILDDNIVIKCYRFYELASFWNRDYDVVVVTNHIITLAREKPYKIISFPNKQKCNKTFHIVYLISLIVWKIKVGEQRYSMAPYPTKMRNFTNKGAILSVCLSPVLRYSVSQSTEQHAPERASSVYPERSRSHPIECAGFPGNFFNSIKHQQCVNANGLNIQ